MHCFILYFEVEGGNRPKDAPKIVWPSFFNCFLDSFQFFFKLIYYITFVQKKKATYVHNIEILLVYKFCLGLVLNLQGLNITETNWLISQCDIIINERIQEHHLISSWTSPSSKHLNAIRDFSLWQLRLPPCRMIWDDLVHAPPPPPLCTSNFLPHLFWEHSQCFWPGLQTSRC